MVRTGSRNNGTIATRIVTVIAMGIVLISASPPVAFVDLSTPFERVAIATTGQREAARIAAVRNIDALLPGVYPTGADTNQLITKALAEFPSKRAGYEQTVRNFPMALNSAVARFRTVFPGFTPSLPIYLYHSLGERDGGSDYLEPGHRHVMLFGADMIAEYHADNSLEPFMDHELFHLEHAHAFSDCDQFWCGLWQEGLAVDAAAAMTPGATDHQLLLDIPTAIRGPTNARWRQALCFVSTHFDDTTEAVIGQALFANGKPPPGLPARFGYYVGFRIAQATRQPVPALDHLHHDAARRLVRTTLVRLMDDAKADCGPPASNAAITRRSPHPV